MAVSVVLLLAFLIGVVCGLRTFTGPALVCWGARLGWLNLAGSHLAFLANLITVIIFSVLALGELAADKTSKIGRRTAPGPLSARLLSGALCGGAFAIAGGASVVLCCLFGIVGALAGAFGGYSARHAATREGRLPDLPVALFEDLVAIGGGWFLVSRF